MLRFYELDSSRQKRIHRHLLGIRNKLKDCVKNTDEWVLQGQHKYYSELHISAIPFIRIESGYIVNLEIGKFDLKSLPDGLRILKKLRVLKIRYNELDSVPAEIFKLRYLEELNLSVNRILEIPTEISNLKNLRELNLSQNINI